MELEGGKIIDFDVLGTKQNEPAENKNQLANDIKNKRGKEDVNTQAGKNRGDIAETLAPKGKIKGGNSYDYPYKMRNMVVFLVLLAQGFFLIKNLSLGIITCKNSFSKQINRDIKEL